MTGLRPLQLLLLMAALFAYTVCASETRDNRFSGHLSLALQDAELKVQGLTPLC